MSNRLLSILKTVLSTVLAAARPRAELLMEIAALRQQLDVYRRQGRRPVINRRDRMFWIWLQRRWRGWKRALVIVKPETVLRWHREGYRAYWRWRSKGKPGRPRIPRKHIEFIRRISSDHPEWGEDKIALELKLNARLERFMGTLKRECLLHFIFVSEGHLRRTVAEYVTYYNEARPSQAIAGIPKCGVGQGPSVAAADLGDGPLRLVARPILGGLHHDYELARLPRNDHSASNLRDPCGRLRPRAATRSAGGLRVASMQAACRAEGRGGRCWQLRVDG